MKITISLTPSQFEELHNILNQYNLQETQFLGRETKVKRYIVERVIVKIRKLHIDNASKVHLFNQKKKIKISIEYFEAHFLEIYFLNLVDIIDNDYTKNTLLMIINQLNQKLE